MSEGRSDDIVVVVGGHSYDDTALAALLDATCGRRWRWCERDDVGALDVAGLSVEVRYDIAGLALARGREPEPADPTVAERTHLAALSQAGVGLVVLHHAIASWPTWDAWADGIGARFFYAPGRWGDRAWPASGYAMGRLELEPVAGHPVTEGVEAFTIDDEQYLCPTVPGLEPLLRVAVPLQPEAAIDTHHEVVVGERRPALDHPPADPAVASLVGWCTSVGRSPVVVLLPGHGRPAFEHPDYRRLIANAVDWAGSDDARRWAVDRGAPGFSVA